MKTIVGWLSLGFAAALALSGCSHDNSSSSEEAIETGTLALPLVTHGPSGITYRLQNATFEIVSYGYYRDDYYGTGGGGWGTGSSYSTRHTIIAKTDNNSDDDALQVDLEQGDYYVRLLSGWQLAKVEGSSSTVVEAQLLSGQTQWTWISPHSTSYIEYEFGIGGRSVWFNGKLNVNIVVHESPDEIYGGMGGGCSGTSYRGTSCGVYGASSASYGNGGAGGISE